MLSIELADGRTICADKIVAMRTYLGLIEGVPNDRVNEWTIDDFKSYCGRAFCIDRFGVLPPAMKAREFKGRSWRALPANAIGGLFRSVRTVRDHDKTYSIPAILWFQDELEPLLSPPVLAQLRQIEWARLAEDVDD